MPGLDREAATREAVYAHAEACLHRGAPPVEMERQLAATGLSPHDATKIVNDLIARRALYDMAARLLDSGASRDETRRQLVETGLDPQFAVLVIDQVQRARSGESAERGGRRSRLVIVGVAVNVLGVLLLLGNQTGLFPTVPFAGFITMGIGSILVLVGQKRP